MCEHNYQEDLTPSNSKAAWSNTDDNTSNATSNYLANNLSKLEPFNPSHYIIVPVESDSSPHMTSNYTTNSNNLLSPKHEFLRLNLPVISSPKQTNTFNSQRQPISFTSLADQNKLSLWNSEKQEQEDFTPKPSVNLKKFNSSLD
jgi:hypothetical protein